MPICILFVYKTNNIFLLKIILYTFVIKQTIMSVAIDNQILSKEDTLQKIKRMAFEIYENNFKEKEIVLVGVVDNGVVFSEMLKKELSSISDLNVEMVEISLDKRKPTQSEISLNVESNLLENKSVILVDDVQYTGRTLAYSLKPFLGIKVKKLQTAVLVDRDHKNFPIAADYVGYSLSTTLKEHITVELNDKNKLGVYLD